MNNTLEERVVKLEQRVEALARKVEEDPDAHRDWQKSFGAFANDESFEEMVRLGAEYRASLRYSEDSEDPGH